MNWRVRPVSRRPLLTAGRVERAAAPVGKTASDFRPAHACLFSGEVYSARNAAAGWMPAARRAGRYEDRIATMKIVTATVTKTSGSRALTS